MMLDDDDDGCCILLGTFLMGAVFCFVDIFNCIQCLFFQFLPDSVAVRQSNSVVASLQNLCSRWHHYMYQYGIYLTAKKSI